MNHKKVTVAMAVILLYTLCTIGAVTTQQISEAIEGYRNCEIHSALTKRAFRTVSSAQVYEGAIGYTIPGCNGNISMTKYYLDDGCTLDCFDTLEELLSSTLFVSTIRDSFRLNDIEDGLLFQQFLYEVDEEYFNEGFFFEDNTWYFVRDEFFGDLEAWIAFTDENGTIVSLEHTNDGSFVMSDQRYEDVSTDFRNEKRVEHEIPSAVSDGIRESLKQQFVSEITVDPINDPAIASICSAHLFNCEIAIITTYEDMTSTSYYDILASESENETAFYEDTTEFVSSSLFVKSLSRDFLLVDDHAAARFETVLDLLTDFDRTEKTRFERNGRWIFIRDEFFDDGRGFFVDTDKSGSITQIEYSWEIPLEGVEVEVEEPFDESKVVWNFDLMEPGSTDITISKDENIFVSIEFNEWASNKIGGWIGTFVNGQMAGMLAGTSISTPFMDTIPGEYLTEGEQVVSYRLLRPGRDYDNPIASVDLTITVTD
ncbi:MAG: hypothetical protein ACPKOP_09440 [Sphaerochaetaceae bacterium]